MRELAQPELLNEMQDWRPAWPTPFVVKLHGGSADQSLLIEDVLRQLPKRRIVAKGRYEDKDVLAKIAPRSDGLNMREVFQREADMSERLIESGIDTPQLRHLVDCTDDDILVLMFDFVPDARTLLQLDDRPDASGQLLPAFRQAVTLLSKLHEQGFVHRDPHLGNFLLSPGRLYMIDCADVESCNDIPEQQQNLVLLLAQLPPLTEAAILEIADAYTCNRKILTEAFLKSLPAAVERQWWRRTEKYLRKIQRNCTEVVVEHGFRQRTVYKRALDAEGLGNRLDDPDSLFDTVEWLKQGNSASVGKVIVNDRIWVVKRYNIKSVWHWLRRFWRKSRAWHSWHNAHLLQRLRVATPAPIAYIEKRIGPLRSQAYYVSEYVNAGELSDVVGSRPMNELEKQKLKALFSSLAWARLYHGDFKARNVLTDGQDIYLIDLDAMYRSKGNPAQAARLHAKDIERFLNNRCFDENLRQNLQKLIQ